ncbi:MAG: helix-turn-helix domain-containing protein, partial [Desulfobacterales bacterium]|nr:helix-turn-helix domain-containing protein [Desulfobacterales bacterium]
MSHTHQYNFKGQGPTTQSYRKLWLEHFKDGTFKKASPLEWRVFSRLLFGCDYFTYQCEITQSEIAADCGTHRTTIPKTGQGLTKLSLIVSQNKITRAGKQPNRYILTTPASNTDQTQEVIYAGEVMANEEVDINITSKAVVPAHVRLPQELFDNGYFASLDRDHCTWKIYCCLLYRADFKTGYCFPSIKQISEDTGIGCRTINKSLN